MNTAKIDLSKKIFLANIGVIKKNIGDQKFGLVVKSNAYGHGMQIIAACAQNSGLVDYLLTFSASEALALRKVGVVLPIVVMGCVDIAADICAENDIEVIISGFADLDVLKAKINSKKNLRVHIKVDTGLGRLGYGAESIDFEKFVQRACFAKNIDIVGVFSHCADSIDSNPVYIHKQLDLFVQAIEIVYKCNKKQTLCVHLFSSGTIEIAKLLTTRLREISVHNVVGMVRIGSSAYGFYKSEKHKESLRAQQIFLNPIATCHTRIAAIKDVSVGDCVGYGCQFRASHTMRIALLPIGYADGYSRASLCDRFVEIKGKKAAIVGGVCMNMVACDVTNISGVSVNDDVIWFAPHGPANYCSWAWKNERLPWEVLTCISPTLPRRWSD